MSLAPSASAVLIVGAGPTGLTLAHELLRHGVKPRLIEKGPVASHNTKALGVMPRTLELLAPSGITPDMLAQGVQVPFFSIWSSNRRLVNLDFARDVDSPYPYILMLPQHMTEAILADHIARWGGGVERAVELITLTQRERGVEAILRHADGTEEHTWNRFVIGCDGVHSTVRRLLGVPFVGTTVAQQFVTGDVRMDWQIPHNQALACINGGHVIAYFPLADGQHRLLSASPAKQARSGEVTAEEIQRVIDICGPSGARATNPGWLARCQVHRRMVPWYVHQRVLLAGDAAHSHSPLGAQGMNTGMQDAMNLAWKLALVAQDRAPARLLDSYHVERSAVGKRLLQEDALLTHLGLWHHPAFTVARDRVAPYLIRHTPLPRFLTRTAAGLRISYDQGPLALDHGGENRKSGASGRRIGMRAPNGLLTPAGQGSPSQLFDLLSGPGHTLLLFSSRRDVRRWAEVQSALAEWQDLIAVYSIQRSHSHREGEPPENVWLDPDGTLARRYGIAEEGLVLIRPDGYVSFRSQPIAAEALQRFLCAHFSVQRSS